MTNDMRHQTRKTFMLNLVEAHASKLDDLKGHFRLHIWAGSFLGVLGREHQFGQNPKTALTLVVRQEASSHVRQCD